MPHNTISYKHTSYRKVIKDNDINGEVLLLMKTKEDWKEVGVTSFGDVRLLISKIGKLQENQ
jgi:hypothetical protein